jgi:hypothetical protein
MGKSAWCWSWLWYCQRCEVILSGVHMLDTVVWLSRLGRYCLLLHCRVEREF